MASVTTYMNDTDWATHAAWHAQSDNIWRISIASTEMNISLARVFFIGHVKSFQLIRLDARPNWNCDARDAIVDLGENMRI